MLFVLESYLQKFLRISHTFFNFLSIFDIQEDHKIEHFQGYFYLKFHVFPLFTSTKSSLARTTLFSGRTRRSRPEQRTHVCVWKGGLFAGMIFYDWIIYPDKKVTSIKKYFFMVTSYERKKEQRPVLQLIISGQNYYVR